MNASVNFVLKQNEMKRVSTFFVLTMLSAATWAQTNPITEAIIHSTTLFSSTESEEMALSQVQAGGNERMRFRAFMDGETKTTTYLRGPLMKTDFKSETSRGSVIRDNEKKITTTLTQMMGRKTGFYVTDQDQEDMKKRMDSLREERTKNDTSTRRRSNPSTERNVALVETDDTKKIAGYTCKKAYIVRTNFLGQKDSTAVWYSPELKFENLKTVGGISGLGNILGNTAGLQGTDLIDGFVMQYETNLGRNRKMEVKVTKVELGKKIDDKTFEIPKGYDVKPMSEMQNMFGGSGRTMQWRMGNP